MICIVGPTATGKTKLSIKIAKLINGYILNCDSVQIYKRFDIVSGKITDKEKKFIRHELIDIANPNEKFTLNDYLKNIHKILKKQESNNYNPILVGGTGLYYSAFVDQYFLPNEDNDNYYRKKLYFLLKEKGKNYIYEMLEKIDPKSAKTIHRNDVFRIIRALEIYKKTGQFIWYYKQKKEGLRKDIKSFGLQVDRKILYEKINKRVDKMIKKGLVDEVKYLLNKYNIKKDNLIKIIGYKEIINYLDGIISFEKAIELIKQNSRRYCKKQITWFKKRKEIIWLPYNKKNEIKESKNEIIKYVLKNN